MTDEQIKQILETKKEQIKQSFKDKATYDKWDKHSPIWAYSLLTGECKKITEPKVVKLALSAPQSFVHYFFTKESMETYKWTHEFIETIIDERVIESFSSGKIFDNFISFENLVSEDTKVYYIQEEK